MSQKVLFVGTKYMGIYKHVLAEFERLGYEVDFVAERNCLDDPNNQRGYKGIRKLIFGRASKFNKENEAYWNQLLTTGPYLKVYDILFVLDGQSLHPILFEILKQRNSNLYSVNYLFDTTAGVYRFDKFFKYFDKVVTFDRGDAKKHNIELLPIFWIPAASQNAPQYKFFGMGAFKHDRFALFESVANYAKSNNMPYYIRLFVPEMSHFKIKSTVRKITGFQKDKVTPAQYYSDLITHQSLPLEEFQTLLESADIILDTNAPHQDGLTARFTAAVGLGKKIITTNKEVVHYSFYTEAQIFIVSETNRIGSKEFVSFVNTPFRRDKIMTRLVESFRLDNWLLFLLQKFE